MSARPASAYQMRTPATAEDKDATCAMVKERILRPGEHQADHGQGGAVLSAIRDSAADLAVLFDDRRPLGCVQLHFGPSLDRWSRDQQHEPTLLLSGAHSRPGVPDKVAWLMTLWARDFAARMGLEWVRCEVLTPPGGQSRLVDYLRTNCGWTRARSLFHPQPVVLLQCPAEPMNGLTALLESSIPPPKSSLLAATGPSAPRAAP